MRASFVLWLGLAALATGIVLLLIPRTRRSGVCVAIFGLCAIAAAIAWPARESHVLARSSRIDDVMPAWQFNEVHTTHVRASPERVFAAAHAVTAREILLFRTLIAIRRGWRQTPESIMHAPADEPLLDVATRTTFRYVADEPPREIVVTTRVARGVDAVMNFLITSDGHGGSNLSTETRVFAADAQAKRSFAVYWRVIQPGSDIIRRMWLRAIRLRAEKD